MADQQEWPPERLRALDRAVAQARGWKDGRFMKGEFGYAQEVWLNPDGARQALPEVSKGCAETFELMEEERIDVGWTINDKACAWVPSRRLGGFLAPTPAIAICLAYLASKGRSFNG